MNYEPSPTGVRFAQSRANVKLICGPVGGGKSTVALMTLWAMAVQQEPFKNVRRTKFIILRNTMAQLKSTVKPLIDTWFLQIPAAPLGEWRMSDTPTFEIKLRLGDGTILHTEFMMMAADTPDDVRRLLSMECSAAWVEEAREVVEEVRDGLQGRINRFPPRIAGGVTYPCMLLSTNAPVVGSDLHKLMTDTPKGHEVFIQPPALLDDGALNPDAENLSNLNPGYYENLIAGKTEAWLDVFMRNKFGSGGFGQPVFKGTFRRDFHVAKQALQAVPATLRKVIVGSDNGLTAAAVIGQENALGKVNVLAEAYVPQGETMGYDRFLDSLLMPKLRELGVPNNQVLFVVDPACFARSQANEVTIAMIIQRRGFQVLSAPTNDPERRVAAVEGLLVQQIEGKARLEFSPTCEHVIAALDWGYRNRRQVNGQMSAAVDKNHHSHIGDAMQYFALYYNNAMADKTARPSARTVKPAKWRYT